MFAPLQLSTHKQKDLITDLSNNNADEENEISDTESDSDTSEIIDVTKKKKKLDSKSNRISKSELRVIKKRALKQALETITKNKSNKPSAFQLTIRSLFNCIKYTTSITASTYISYALLGNSNSLAASLIRGAALSLSNTIMATPYIGSVLGSTVIEDCPW